MAGPCRDGRVQRRRWGFVLLRPAVLKAVIFDIDGTLIDSVDLHARSWVDSFARFGVQVTFDNVRSHIGEGADRLIPAFVPPGMPDDKRKQLEEFRSELFKRDYVDKVKVSKREAF
jgi:beta-phosphoglucomutase-like phosphatase (HAD superfamily)